MVHPLVRLAALIDWKFLDDRVGLVCQTGPRQPGLPTRLVASLFILKHMHNLSGEVLCARWIENPYYRAPRSRRVSAGIAVLKKEQASRSRPAGADFKPLQAAVFKRRGGERWGKGGELRRQVSDEKMKRKRTADDASKWVQTLSKRAEECGRHLFTVHAVAGGIGGMISSQASTGTWEPGSGCQGKSASGAHHE